MRKILIAIGLILIAVSCYGQDTTPEDELTMKSTVSSTDTVRVIKNGESALMLAGTLLQSCLPKVDTADLLASYIERRDTADMLAPYALLSEVTKTKVGLSNVENTALSTWTGSANISALGTIISGSWTGTAIASGYIASALTGKSVNGVTLDATGLATVYLNGTGSYSVPPGSGGTTLASGTVTATTYGITSDGGADDIVLPEANTSEAGLLGAAKWNSLTANTAWRTGAVHIDTVVHMLADTLVVVGRLGAGNDGDTATMHDGANLMLWPVAQDTIVCDSSLAICFGTAADLNVRLYYLDDESDSPNYIQAALNPVTGTGDGSSGFTTPMIPPGKLIGCDIIGLPSTQPTRVYIYLFYHEKRAF